MRHFSRKPQSPTAPKSPRAIFAAGIDLDGQVLVRGRLDTMATAVCGCAAHGALLKISRLFDALDVLGQSPLPGLPPTGANASETALTTSKNAVPSMLAPY